MAEQWTFNPMVLSSTLSIPKKNKIYKNMIKLILYYFLTIVIVYNLIIIVYNIIISILSIYFIIKYIYVSIVFYIVKFIINVILYILDTIMLTFSDATFSKFTLIAGYIYAIIYTFF